MTVYDELNPFGVTGDRDLYEFIHPCVCVSRYRLEMNSYRYFFPMQMSLSRRWLWWAVLLAWAAVMCQQASAAAAPLAYRPSACQGKASAI